MALKDIVPIVPAVPINRYLWSVIAELDADLVWSGIFLKSKLEFSIFWK